MTGRGGILGATSLVGILACSSCSWWITDADIQQWQDAHTDTGTGPPQVDILILTDNSSSVTELGVPLPVSKLWETLDEELEGWDYQVGLTTLNIDYDSDGPTTGLDLGEAGTLLEGTVLRSSEKTAALTYVELVLCNATCFYESSVESDPDYDCADLDETPPDTLSTEYLDCLCGVDEWLNHCGAGTEEGLEALALRLCMEADAIPSACESPLSPLSEAIEAHRDSEDLFREGVPLKALLVSDEGDTSRRLENGDASLGDYQAIFDEFDDLRVSVIGPAYDVESEEFPCNSGGATTWGAERYMELAAQTGGTYAPIEVEDEGSCDRNGIKTLLEAWVDTF